MLGGSTQGVWILSQMTLQIQMRFRLKAGMTRCFWEGISRLTRYLKRIDQFTSSSSFHPAHPDSNTNISRKDWGNWIICFSSVEPPCLAALRRGIKSFSAYSSGIPAQGRNDALFLGMNFKAHQKYKEHRSTHILLIFSSFTSWF